ncbi:MAG TPA: hypothetical protein VL225_18845 [Vicinamibacterales bacterium]|nr:hypothetical protein [Vicinamibacterales bacterium]
MPLAPAAVESPADIWQALLDDGSTGRSGCHGGQGGAIPVFESIGGARREPKIPQQSVTECVDPAVDRHGLSARPGILQDGRVADIPHLFDDVQLTQAIGAILRHVENSLVPFVRLSNGAQPIVNQSEPCALKCRLDTAAAVVSAHDHVAGSEHVDGILQDGQAVQIGLENEIRDVSVYEQLARSQADDFIRGHPAVGAPDPEISRGLLGGEPAEKFRIGINRSRRPGPIVLEQLREGLHRKDATTHGRPWLERLGTAESSLTSSRLITNPWPTDRPEPDWNP